MKKNKIKKTVVLCSRCGAELNDNHVFIKTKRRTVLRFCSKCMKEGP